MKTIKEWFESVKDETIRTELLANMDEHKQNITAPSLWMAIAYGAKFSPNFYNYNTMAQKGQIELIPDTPKIKKSALDKRITGLQLKYELLKDVEIKELTKRIESLEEIVKSLSQPIQKELHWINPLAKTTIYNENEQTNVVGNCSGLPEKKIVFEAFINADRTIKKASSQPEDFNKVTQISDMRNNKYLFEAWHEGKEYPLIYIGHYEPKK